LVLFVVAKRVINSNIWGSKPNKTEKNQDTVFVSKKNFFKDCNLGSKNEGPMPETESLRLPRFEDKRKPVNPFVKCCTWISIRKPVELWVCMGLTNTTTGKNYGNIRKKSFF